ncbi:MAG TPA: alpha/beta fold hydrolase [Candidatus Acidoferrales bacterium]|nr:alpha/beta fold hydrolase [Candidatus Acidoferrales bacterium]
MRILGVAVLSGLMILLVLAVPALPAGQTPPQQDNEALARSILADLVARKFEAVEPYFDARVAAALPTDKLLASWDTLLGLAGDFVSVESVRSEMKQGYQVVYVSCKFSRDEWVVIFAFDAQNKIAQFRSVPASSFTPWAAPSYAKPESFTERSVTIGSAPRELPGTLTIPKGTGPFPAAVLVHGSGPNDADETIGPNKTFKDLAWGLACRGVAVLRYVKRTRQHGAEMMKIAAGFTVKEETEDDARAAVALLATQPEIDARHIFVIGHSLGAYLAPRIAVGDPQIAGIILMAGCARPLEDMVLEQTKFQTSLNGPPNEDGLKAIARAEQEKRDIEDPNLKPGVMLHSAGAAIPSIYFLDLRNYDPVKVAASLKIPMLILQGEKDVQVRMVDFDDFKRGLGGRKDVTLKSYPLANHLFMTVAGQASGAEYMTPSHVEQDVVEDIASWIHQQSPSPAPK